MAVQVQNLDMFFYSQWFQGEKNKETRENNKESRKKNEKTKEKNRETRESDKRPREKDKKTKENNKKTRKKDKGTREKYKNTTTMTEFTLTLDHFTSTQRHIGRDSPKNSRDITRFFIFLTTSPPHFITSIFPLLHSPVKIQNKRQLLTSSPEHGTLYSYLKHISKRSET